MVAIAVLAFNLSSAMKRLVLGGQWVSSVSRQCASP